MSLIIGAISPHPPLLIPEIGRGEIKKVNKTDKSLEIVGKRFNELNLDTIIFISPHSPYLPGKITIFSNKNLFGSFYQFGYPNINFNYENDIEIIDSLIKEGIKHNIEFYRIPPDYELDHGILVPLYYIDKYKTKEIKIVAMSQHFTIDIKRLKIVGEVIRNVCEKSDKKIGIIASGDMSHRLLKTGPYGYHPSGPKFDSMVIKAIEDENFDELISIPEDTIEEAGECGYRSIITIYSILDFNNFKSKILSYEGPFGVGYLVVLIERRE